MDQNPITLDDSSKASGHMDLHPNRDEFKGKSEFPIKASPTKDVSGNAETVSGNAMFVKVHNSNETHKVTSEQPTIPHSYQSFGNKEQKTHLPDHSDIKSTTNVNMIPGNAKTESSMMASSIPAMSTFKKSSLPQDADGTESKSDNDRTSSECFNASYKSKVNDTMAIHPKENASDSKNETKSNNELKEKCDPSSLNIGCSKDITDKSDKIDNQIINETIKYSGATGHGVETLVNSSQGSVMPNKIPLQSQNMFSKSNAHQYSFDDSHRKADSIDTKKNIDSTFTSSLPSHNFKSANLDNISEGDNSSSSAKSLASLDKEIAEKKAKAMLPIQKTTVIPPKTTSSLFGGSGGLLKAGSGKGGFMDGLLKQAEARAAKEASEAAAAAIAKKSDSKPEPPKEILLPLSNPGTRSELEVETSSKVDFSKGSLSFEKAEIEREDIRSMNKVQSDSEFSSKQVHPDHSSRSVFKGDNYVSDLKLSNSLESENPQNHTKRPAVSTSSITQFSQTVYDKSAPSKTLESASNTKFLSHSLSSTSESKLENVLSHISARKEVATSIPADKTGSVQVTCSTSKSETIQMPSKSKDTKEKEQSSPLKRDFVDMAEAGSPPERKRFKSQSSDEPHNAVSSVKLSKMTESDFDNESSSLSKHSSSESLHSSIKTSVNKSLLGQNEGTSEKHFYKQKSDLKKESVEEAMGKLFGSSASTPPKSSKGEGVTISPVRCKDSISTGSYSNSSNSSSNSSNSSRLKLQPSLNLGSEKPPLSSTVTSNSSSKVSESKLPSSPGSTSGPSIGSVTITKLSTGSSLNVKSKDLKNILGASSDSSSPSLDSSNSGLMSPSVKNKLSVSKASGIHDISFDKNGFNLKSSNVDVLPISDIEGAADARTISSMESSSLSIKSIGDKNSIDVGSKKGSSLSPNSDSSSSSSSSSRVKSDDSSSLQSLPFNSGVTKSSAVFDNPGRVPSTGGSSISSPSSTYSGSKKFNSSSTVSSGVSKSSSPSSKLSNSTSDPNDQRNKIKCKLIRDSKDELHIEGRPKLSIKKVSTSDIGAMPSNTISRNPPSGSISIVPERKSGSAGGGKPMAKLKLSETNADSFKRDREQLIMSKNTGGSNSSSSSYNKTAHFSKKHTSDSNSSLSMSSLSTNSSSKHTSSLSIVSASSSSSKNHSSSGSSSNVKTINFPSHLTHGGKPITMKTSSSSNSSTKPSSSSSNSGSGNVQKSLSASSPNNSKSSDIGKSDISTGSKLKIKLSVNSANNGPDGKSSSSGTSTNIKSGSDMGKISNSGSNSHMLLDNKDQYMKSSGGSITECDNGEQLSKNNGGSLSEDHDPPSGFPSFEFAGKPTYSPSRVEPNPSIVASVTNALTTNSSVTSVQPTKESPRDASNKDSPASQADSGVFSIASSNSPSKDRDGGSGSSGTASTSPDSPNRIDRMLSSFGEQGFSSSSASVGGINTASRDGSSNWKTSNVTQNQGDNITGKSEAQQLHSSSSTAYNKSSSIDDTSNVLKSSLSGDNSTYTKSVSNSETLSTSSKCSSQTTNASSQHSFEEASKNSLQPGGPRGINANQTPFQQQRQQALQQQQQMMQQGYTNGPNSSSSRPGSNTDPSGYPSMYRSDSGNFSNVGGRPPYGPNNSYNQKNPDFFGFDSTGMGSGIGRGGEPPAKRKRGRPRKAGMDGMPRDPNKPPKRSYVRKKKPENQIEGGSTSGSGQNPSRLPVAGVPQQRHRQGSSTFGSGSGSGEGRGTDNVYNFDEEEFQDDTFGSLRMGQKKSSYSSSQTSGSVNNSNSNKFIGTGGFGSQDSSDEDFGMSSQPSSQVNPQSGMKSSSMMSHQSGTNYSGMTAASGSNAMSSSIRPQYSGANMGLRQQGPLMGGGRGNMMGPGMRGGMGGHMGQMNQQRMQAMQGQRMQMQSQQHMQQMGMESEAEKEENAYTSQVVDKGTGIKLKIKLKKPAEEEGKKSRKRKQDEDGSNSNSPMTPGMSKPGSDKFSSAGSMMPNSGTHSASSSSGNINNPPSTMGGMASQHMHQQSGRTQPQFAGMSSQQNQQYKPDGQQNQMQSNQYKMGQTDNRQTSSQQPPNSMQNQQMNYQSQMSNKNALASGQHSNNMQQTQGMRSQQQMMQQQQMQSNNLQQQRNSMQNTQNQPNTSMNPHQNSQGQQPNQMMSHAQQQHPNQMPANKNSMQHPGSNLQRPNMGNMNPQMNRQGSMDGSPMQHQMQQRMPSMGMNSPNNPAAGPMMGGSNAAMRNPMIGKNPNSPATSQPNAQGGSFNSNQGAQGNIANSGMVNPFSQQQMMQQKQRQMMGATPSSANSPMNSLANMAQGVPGSSMGPVSSQGNNNPQTNKTNNMMSGMNQNNPNMNIRPNLPGQNYGMSGGIGMNMGPNQGNNNPSMNMGPNSAPGHGMGGNSNVPGSMGGINGPFPGGPNQFGNAGTGGNRMNLPYNMQQQQANFYGGGNQPGHGNFGQNPMANNFMQMQQRQRMMAMQGMQNQFNGPNGMAGQFGGMGGQGNEQFGNSMYNGPNSQFGGPNGMGNNSIGGGMGPRPGMFNPSQQAQMGGFNGQQRMMGPGPMGDSQQVPPQFRGGPGGPQNLGPNGMNNMGMPGNQSGPIGAPKFSPSAMQKPMPGVGMGPMPGVGMPKISPGNMGGIQQSPQHQGMQHNNPQLTPRHPTPLVSPQSMHSMHDNVNSPANTNPLTPGGNGGPATPNQHPSQMTPSHYGNMASPSMNHSSMHNNPMTPQSHHMMTTSPHPSMTSPHPSMTSPHPSMGPSPSPRGPGGEQSHLYSGPSSGIAPSPQQSYHPSCNDDGQQSQNQQMMSPAHMGMQMKSPMMPMGPGPSNLRKIRRPSKPRGESSDDYAGNNGQNESIDIKEENPQTPSTPQRTAFKEEPDVKPDIKPDIKEEIKQEEPDEPKFEAKWEELPNKVLARVFAYCVANESSNTFLVKASKVCRKWWKVAMPRKYSKHCELKDEDEEKDEDLDKSGDEETVRRKKIDLWTHLDLSVSYLKEKHRNDKKLEQMLKKYSNVLELKLNGWKNAVNTSTLKLIAASKQIVSLSMVGCFKLTNEDLKLIGDTLPNLQRIDLSNVSASSCSSRSAVSSTALSDFITTVGERLTHFNISNNKMAGLPFVFKALSTNSKNLEDLDISNITTTSRDTILINMEKFQKGCPKLRVLNANHTMLSLVETPVKEQIQSPGFPLLRELYIAVDSRGYFDGMDDGQIERVLKKSVDLRTLDVRGCQHVTESCLIRLPTWDIEKLVVAGCSAVSSSSDGLELMVRKWSRGLKELDVSGTSGERTINNAFEALIDAAPDTVIKKLNICSTSASLKPLTRLLKNCPTIEYLNLSSCRGLPRGMKRLYSKKDDVLQLKKDILEGKFNGNEDSD